MMKGLATSAFRRMLSVLPGPLADAVSGLGFKVSGRPYVFFDPALHPAARLKRGAVTFSADFEMAWAFRYSRSSAGECVAMGLREREQVPKILAAMEEYTIPITWATVGHLFLSQCTRGANGLAHPELRRPDHFDGHWRFTSGDWYQHDPCSDVKKDPAWYAPDLIEAILSSRCHHEVASHGFSHMGFGDYCSDEVAEAELDASVAAMGTFGLRPRTFVFPGNEVGKLRLISAKGFEIVRSFPFSLSDISLPLRLPEGPWGIHSTSPVDTGTMAVNSERRLARYLKFVDRAIEARMCAHFWFHPSLSDEQLNGLLIPLLRTCAELREKGLLDVMTVGGVVDETIRAGGPQRTQKENLRRQQNVN